MNERKAMIIGTVLIVLGFMTFLGFVMYEDSHDKSHPCPATGSGITLPAFAVAGTTTGTATVLAPVKQKYQLFKIPDSATHTTVWRIVGEDGIIDNCAWTYYNEENATWRADKFNIRPDHDEHDATSLYFANQKQANEYVEKNWCSSK